MQTVQVQSALSTACLFHWPGGTACDVAELPRGACRLFHLLRIVYHLTDMETNLPAHDVGPLTVLTCPIGALLQVAFNLIQPSQPSLLPDLRRGALTLRA